MSEKLYKATERTIAMSTYPGYPTERLVIEDAHDRDDLTLPDGEWSTSITTFPTLEQQDTLAQQGYDLDSYGRPLHPWLRDMLSNPEVGVVTGLGEYWNWGPNKTADPIIITNEERPRILLVKRSDTGAWALPGGYVDPGETAGRTALRESAEEASVIVSGDPVHIYNGVVADSRTTAHAWAETTALLWKVQDAALPFISSESTKVAWKPLDDLPAELHGSHAVLIEQALEQLDNAPLGSTISFGEPLTAINQASGGHMGYDRSILTTESGARYFVKQHSDDSFTDELKRSRSRLYLQKEYLLYDHLQVHAPAVIPTGVQLVGNQSLVMEGLASEQGWKWRAPKEHVAKYTVDIIRALEQITPIPVLEEPFAYTIKPSYETHIEEGWQAITDDTLTDIRAKITAFADSIRRPEFRIVATQLTSDLPRLAQAASNITDPNEFYFTHHDLRQANVAWHPEHGAKIVDWSWAGPGRKLSDTTTLLIDLHKSGHDVRSYMQYFDRDHALTLIGFWLAHSLYPTPSDDNSVRFQQVLSAVSAYDLLVENWQR